MGHSASSLCDEVGLSRHLKITQTLDIMANRKKYLTEFKARLCSVVAGTMAEIAELAYSLPREKDYKGASYISYSDRALKKIACGHRLRIYREISSNTFKKHFPQMKKIDALKASEFTKTLMLMTSLGFDNNEIIVFLLTDKRTISSTRSKIKKTYKDECDFS